MTAEHPQGNLGVFELVGPGRGLDVAWSMATKTEDEMMKRLEETVEKMQEMSANEPPKTDKKAIEKYTQEFLVMFSVMTTLAWALGAEEEFKPLFRKLAVMNKINEMTEKKTT